MQNLPPYTSPVKITRYSSALHILYRFPGIRIIAGSSKSVMGCLLFVLIFLASCAPAKNTSYFQSLPKDTVLTNLVSKDYEPKIQKNDLLSIAVASLSPDITFYNAPQNTVGTVTGYLVDENGNIQFIKLGTLHVEGLTEKELKAMLEKDLVPYLKDAVVNVGFLNRHITLLGGIGSQIIPLPTDNMTILDALAVGGDIGEKGRTDNILVIREKNNSKEFKRLNLTDNSIFYSPYFYLQPNDIVYVEPVPVKSVVTTAQIISYILSGISIFILLYNSIR